MAEFRFMETAPAGCLICMHATSPRGFVDAIAEVMLMRDNTQIGGVADVILCGTCLEQMARMVGCASKEDVENAAYREYELSEENLKLKDEVKAWQQRHENLVNAISNGELVEA